MTSSSKPAFDFDKWLGDYTDVRTSSLSQEFEHVPTGEQGTGVAPSQLSSGADAEAANTSPPYFRGSRLSPSPSAAGSAARGLEPPFALPTSAAPARPRLSLDTDTQEFFTRSPGFQQLAEQSALTPVLVGKCHRLCLRMLLAVRLQLSCPRARRHAIRRCCSEFGCGCGRAVASSFLRSSRARKLQAAIVLALLTYVFVQMQQLSRLRDYNGAVASWVRADVMDRRSAGETRSARSASPVDASLDAPHQRTYVMFDRASPGPIERPRALDLTLSPDCANTRQGPRLIADDRGFLCSFEEVLSEPLDATDAPGLGCCPAVSITGFERYSCETCDAATGCCSQYEACVSCCTNPTKYAELMSYVEMGTHPAYFSARTPFDLCLFKCRVSSAATIQENKYKSDQRYCYGMHAPPLAAAALGLATVAGEGAKPPRHIPAVDVDGGEKGGGAGMGDSPSPSQGAATENALAHGAVSGGSTAAAPVGAANKLVLQPDPYLKRLWQRVHAPADRGVE